MPHAEPRNCSTNVAVGGAAEPGGGTHPTDRGARDADGGGLHRAGTRLGGKRAPGAVERICHERKLYAAVRVDAAGHAEERQRAAHVAQLREVGGRRIRAQQHAPRSARPTLGQGLRGAAERCGLVADRHAAAVHDVHTAHLPEACWHRRWVRSGRDAPRCPVPLLCRRRDGRGKPCIRPAGAHGYAERAAGARHPAERGRRMLGRLRYGDDGPRGAVPVLGEAMDLVRRDARARRSDGHAGRGVETAST